MTCFPSMCSCIYVIIKSVLELWCYICCYLFAPLGQISLKKWSFYLLPVDCICSSTKVWGGGGRLAGAVFFLSWVICLTDYRLKGHKNATITFWHNTGKERDRLVSAVTLKLSQLQVSWSVIRVKTNMSFMIVAKPQKQLLNSLVRYAMTVTHRFVCSSY